MFKTIIFGTLFLAFGSASAVEVYSINQTTPIEEQLAENCPWIQPESVKQVGVVGPEKIGWSGGEGSKVLGKIMRSSRVNLNFSNIAGNLPASTRAILFNAAYYNNNGLAEIIVDEIELITSTGVKVGLPITTDAKVLSQSSNESILLCFTAEESYVRIRAKLTHQNVDGSRPTMGITALVNPEPITLPSR
ncbi:MAG: hypothetical protein K2Q26_15775 [Bdellovibrionales bacterium]|nr:hypothetical protein [Bdellovibrionales bacterium]